MDFDYDRGRRMTEIWLLRGGTEARPLNYAYCTAGWFPVVSIVHDQLKEGPSTTKRQSRALNVDQVICQPGPAARSPRLALHPLVHSDTIQWIFRLAARFNDKSRAHP
jgi:hypothetical protein